MDIIEFKQQELVVALAHTDLVASGRRHNNTFCKSANYWKRLSCLFQDATTQVHVYSPTKMELEEDTVTLHLTMFNLTQHARCTGMLDYNIQTRCIFYYIKAHTICNVVIHLEPYINSGRTI